MKKISEISVEELQTLMQEKADFMLLDVREPSEYAESNLGGVLIPLKDLPDRLSELDRNQYIVVQCRSGGRSMVAAEILVAHGFEKVSNLTGGILAWKERIGVMPARF